MEWLDTPRHQFDAQLAAPTGRGYRKLVRVPRDVYEALGASPPIRTRGLLDEYPFELAVLSDGEGAGKLLLGKKVVKQLGKRLGETIRVELQYDDSEYGMSLPPDVQELFEFAPDIKHAFDTQLKLGKQRGMLYHIKSAKTQQTRSKRIAELMEMLGIDTF